MARQVGRPGLEVEILERQVEEPVLQAETLIVEAEMGLLWDVVDLAVHGLRMETRRGVVETY